MKANRVIITSTIALMSFSACTKTKVTAPEAAPYKKQTASAAMALYDYSQPIEQIYRDATGGGVMSPTVQVHIIPGKLVGEDSKSIVCQMTQGICMVVITEKRQKSQLTGAATIITGGTVEEPIVAIKANDHWPQYIPAQELSYQQGDDLTTVTITPVQE